MQSILVVQCAAPGAVYLNGRPAGEIDGERPLTLPVSPLGPLLLELRPFEPGRLPLALRIPFSGGVPLLSAPDPRVWAALWPGGVTELELRPERLPDVCPQPIGQVGEVRLSFLGGDAPLVLCESPSGVFRHALPEGARLPEARLLPSALLISGALTGEADERYALALSPDASSLLLSVSGIELTIGDGGNALRLLRACGDTVGHAALETWSASATGWALTDSEPMWLPGAPHWPDTPQAVALAAAEAAQLNLMSEAASFFAPSVPCTGVLARAAEYDGCVPLRYPLPDGEAAVGLIRVRDNVLRVTPVRYAASPGGAHGAWQLTRFDIGEEA